jgi:hypothetical protein
VLNMTIILFIEVIYAFMNNLSMPELKKYGPLIVLGLLIICFTYSTVLIALELKNKFT